MCHGPEVLVCAQKRGREVEVEVDIDRGHPPPAPAPILVLQCHASDLVRVVDPRLMIEQA